MAFFTVAQTGLENRARALPRVALIAVLGGVVLGIGTAAFGPLYVVAALIGAALGVAFLRNTQVGILSFVAIATLLPFAVLPVPLGAFKLTLIDVTLTTLLLMWLLRLLVTPGARVLVGHPGNLVLVFLLLAIVSYVSGTAYAVSAEATRLFLKIINSILFFFTVLNCVHTRQQVEQIVKGIIIGGTIAAGVGIVLYVLPSATSIRLLSALHTLEYPTGPTVLRYIAGTKTLRATATSIDPNILGATLMLAATLSLSQLMSAFPVLSRKALVVTSGIIAVGLLLTLSRSSWMGLVVALLFIATFKYRRLWALFATIAVALYIGLVPQDIPYLSHLASGFQARDQAAAMRLGEYKDAIRLISSYPWFGVGFGQAPSIDLYVGVSSIYLLMAEQMGLIGVAVFLSIVASLLVKSLRQLGAVLDARWQGVTLGLVAALVAALVAGLFDHHFFNLKFPHTVALFWLVAGLIAVANRLAGRQEEPTCVPR